MEKITVEPAGINDLEAILRIARQTFYETFRDSNSEQDMQDYLNNTLSAEKLTEEILNPGSLFFLVAYGSKHIGYLKLNFKTAQTEKTDGNGIEIERIYIAEAFQGMKAGQMLFNKAIEIAGSAKADFIWLGVWEENKKAIGFYERNGFVPFGKHDFVLGEDVQTDILMKLELNH